MNPSFNFPFSAVEIRDFFEPGGSERLNNVLKKFMVEPNVNHAILQSALTLARTVAKSEQNKSKYLLFLSKEHQLVISFVSSVFF